MTTLAPGELYVKAMAATRAYVDAVPAGWWHAPTPCSEWDVKQVANHLIGENLWAGELYQGKTIGEVGARLDGDLAGDDPAAAYRASVLAASEAVTGPDSMQAVCHLSFGDSSGADYAEQLFMDTLIHGWDIATATRQDAHLDAGLVAACLPIAEDLTRRFRDAGVFGEDLTRTAAADTDPQTRLLALVGRRASSTDEHTASTVAAIARFNAAFDQHDVDGVMAAMTEDCVFENTGPAPDGESYRGAAKVRAFWERFFQENPTAKFVAEDQFAGGDRCVVRWRYDWGAGHVRGVDVFKVRDGRVAEKLCYVKG